MRQFDKPRSSRQTLEELKAQIENARPVVVDKSGRLYAPDLVQQPAPQPNPYQQGYAQPGQPVYNQPQGYQPGQPGYPAQPSQPQNPYDTPLPQGLRVKPSRWF
ncbi:MAG: hypothetical protein J0I20_11590 [Chloroflexi bacterium]|nr:hypothetical protein [Chloroflexota bacterium]OJV92378.1 MAG: hypothetical protein BGO39_31110 [Chloroflexi bacterium 54-19]